MKCLAIFAAGAVVGSVGVLLIAPKLRGACCDFVISKAKEKLTS